MRVALFYTCLVDSLRPSVGFAALELLEAAGCEVVIPGQQTCCGQPAWNSGDRANAAALAKKLIAEFADFDYIVLPSGSCAEHICNQYADILAAEPEWKSRATALAAKVFELSDFLVRFGQLDAVPGEFSGSVTFHDSCSGLRGLGIREQPRALLRRVAGLELKEMAAAEECCGFGGTFSIKFGDIAAAIAGKKCANVQACGADAVVGGDVGCLLNIEGKLRRMGDEKTQVLHYAEVLAGVGHVRRLGQGE